MATVEENVAKIEKQIADATAAARSLENFTFEGRRYNPTEINQDLLPSLNNRLVNAKRQREATAKKTRETQAAEAKTGRATQTILERIERAIRVGENSLDDTFKDFQNGRISQADYATFLNNLDKLRADKVAIEEGATAVPSGRISDIQVSRDFTLGNVVSYYDVVKPQTPSRPVTAPADPKETRTALAAGNQAVSSTTNAPTIVKSEVKRINDVPTRVDTYSDGSTRTSTDTSSPGATPTPTGGDTSGAGGAGVGGKAGGKARKTKVINWEPTFRDTFPAKAWLLDLDRDKYPGLFNLLQKAVTENYTNERFAAEIDGTDFYRELAQSGKVREIKAIVGDLGFDSTDFTKFVSDSINFGWTGDTLKQKTYEEVFRRNADGTFANPTALARARKSNDFLNVQLVATNYFNKASDAAIESVLTGKIMIEDFQRQQREIAKAKYSHLAPLIDQGVTLDDLSANFKQSAARLLELDPAAIDMSQAEYEVALNFGEADKRRVMTTGEWERLLRTDSRYGWEKTENAKEEARSLASNIAQAFGRII